MKSNMIFSSSELGLIVEVIDDAREPDPAIDATRAGGGESTAAERGTDQ